MPAHVCCRQGRLHALRDDALLGVEPGQIVTVRGGQLRVRRPRAGGRSGSRRFGHRVGRCALNVARQSTAAIAAIEERSATRFRARVGGRAWADMNTWSDSIMPYLLVDCARQFVSILPCLGCCRAGPSMMDRESIVAELLELEREEQVLSGLRRRLHDQIDNGSRTSSPSRGSGTSRAADGAARSHRRAARRAQLRLRKPVLAEPCSTGSVTPRSEGRRQNSGEACRRRFNRLALREHSFPVRYLALR